MKCKVRKDEDEHVITMPPEVIEMLGWKDGTTLKIEIGRDFELNATALVITRKA
jgi:antitoxin component of MazEF toxin-antitoxin module